MSNKVLILQQKLAEKNKGVFKQLPALNPREQLSKSFPEKKVSKKEKKKQQEDAETAQAIVDYYAVNPAMLGGRKLAFDFSPREEVVLTPPRGPSSPPGNILLVTVYNGTYPVTVAQLHTIFSRHAAVLRIITFFKSSRFMALVEVRCRHNISQ